VVRGSAICKDFGKKCKGPLLSEVEKVEYFVVLLRKNVRALY